MDLIKETLGFYTVDEEMNEEESERGTPAVNMSSNFTSPMKKREMNNFDSASDFFKGISLRVEKKDSTFAEN